MRPLVVVLLGLLATGCASSVERQAEEEKRARLIDTNVQLAAGYLRQGQYEFAKEKLDKALAIDARDSQANNMMAVLQWQLKEYVPAERYFERAVETENSEAHNNFGAFLCERDRADEAEKWFKRAAANPFYKTPSAALENAGLCHMRKKAYPKAEPYFRDALRIEPTRATSLYHMGVISFDTGRLMAARGFVQRYFQAGQDTPEALWLAVRVERALRNKNDEASYALRLRSKFPTSPEAQLLQKPTTGGKG
jgi:type IV pilus assembly protein PilF